MSETDTTYETYVNQIGALMQKLYELVHGDAEDTLDTDGGPVPTLAGIAKAISERGGLAMYSTLEEGLLETTEGQFFKTPSANKDEVEIIYKHNPGPTAKELGRSLNKPAFDALKAHLAVGGSSDYLGAGPIYPLLTDADGKCLLWFDASEEVIKGAGMVSSNQLAETVSGSQAEFLAGRGTASYVGAGPIYPLLTDQEGKVLIGYDEAAEKVVGAGLSGGAKTFSAPKVLLENPPQPAALNHFIFYGQSLSVGATGKPVLSVSQPYSNLTFAGGPRAFDGTDPVYSPLKPLVEDEITAPDGQSNRGETPCSGMANYATTLRALDGHTPDSHVILASSAGQGGALIAQLDKGSPWYDDVFLPHINEAHAINADHAVQAIGWMQGENDGASETTKASYAASLTQLISDVNADVAAATGQATPTYFLTYQTATRAAIYGQIQQAQYEVARDNPLAFLVTPLYHIPIANDDTHLTNAGYKLVGAYFGRAYKELVDGYEPGSLMPISATVRGQTVTVKFKVPDGPLVIDRTGLADTTDAGFKISDDGGAMTVTSVSAVGDEVRIELDAAPVGDVTVRYALDHLGAGLTINYGASGNVRDSNTDTITIAGTEYPLWHVAPHFEMPAVKLGE